MLGKVEPFFGCWKTRLGIPARTGKKSYLPRLFIPNTILDPQRFFGETCMKKSDMIEHEMLIADEELKATALRIQAEWKKAVDAYTVEAEGKLAEYAAALLQEERVVN